MGIGVGIDIAGTSGARVGDFVIAGVGEFVGIGVSGTTVAVVGVVVTWAVSVS